MPDLTTPEGGTANVAAPVLDAKAAPSVEEVRVLVGGIPILCEVNSVHPCTERHPQPAQYILVYGECNCDPCDPDYEATTAICTRDAIEFLKVLKRSKKIDCPRCGFKFIPAMACVKEWLSV